MGIGQKTAQYLVGYSTIQMTANLYTHMEKEDAAASLIQLERYLSGGSQEGSQRPRESIIGQKSPENLWFPGLLGGGDNRTRTCDLLRVKQAL